MVIVYRVVLITGQSGLLTENMENSQMFVLGIASQLVMQYGSLVEVSNIKSGLLL